MSKQIEIKQCRTCENTFEVGWKNIRKIYCDDCLKERKRKADREHYHQRKKTLLSNIKRECKNCGELFVPIETGTFACCSKPCQKEHERVLRKKHKRFRNLQSIIQRTDNKITQQYTKLQSLQNKKINLCVEYETLKIELGRSA